MPRPKGSKNKAPRKTAKPTSIPTADFTSLIAAKSGCQVLERNNKQNIKYL